MTGNIWTSDFLVAILIPLVVLFLAYRVSPELDWKTIWDLLSPSPPNSDHGPFSLTAAYRSYSAYGHLAASEASRMQRAHSRLSRADTRLSHSIGYPQKLKRLHEVSKLNCAVTDGIARLASSQFPEHEGFGSYFSGLKSSSGDLHKVRESLKHFVRDWSQEGFEERGAFFGPILEIFQQLDGTRKPTVLVPGCGLGRLAWEISELGMQRNI